MAVDGEKSYITHANKKNTYNDLYSRYLDISQSNTALNGFNKLHTHMHIWRNSTQTTKEQEVDKVCYLSKCVKVAWFLMSSSTSQKLIWGNKHKINKGYPQIVK